MCRFRGFCERGPRTEERWLLRGDQMREKRERSSLRDPSRTPLEVPLHTTICGSELWTPRAMKVITAVVIPYPALQHHNEQSGSLAVARLHFSRV